MVKRTPRIVAFAGPKTCGKDTAAKCLFEQNTGGPDKHFVRTPFAEGVKSICHMVFGWSPENMDDPVFKETLLPEWPNIEPRWAMIDIANWMRDKYGGEVWVNTLRHRIEQMELFGWNGCYVITDFRFPEELEWLNEVGALKIYVHREQAEVSLAKAKAEGDAKALNSSESHYELLRAQADLIIYNDRDVEHLWPQVFNAIRNKWGHWQYWPVADGVRLNDY